MGGGGEGRGAGVPSGGAVSSGENNHGDAAEPVLQTGPWAPRILIRGRLAGSNNI